MKRMLEQIKNYFKIDKPSGFVVPQKIPSLDEQLLMLHGQTRNIILVTGISSDDFLEALDFLENELKNMPIDNPLIGQYFRDTVTIQIFLNGTVYSGIEALVKILELRKKKDAQAKN